MEGRCIDRRVFRMVANDRERLPDPNLLALRGNLLTDRTCIGRDEPLETGYNAALACRHDLSLMDCPRGLRPRNRLCMTATQTIKDTLDAILQVRDRVPIVNKPLDKLPLEIRQGFI